jgi:hypothetical protein
LQRTERTGAKQEQSPGNRSERILEMVMNQAAGLADQEA